MLCFGKQLSPSKCSTVPRGSNCSPWPEETLTLPGELGGNQAAGRQHLQAPLFLVILPTGLREPSGRLPPGPGQIAYTPLPHKPVFPTLSQCTFIEQLHVIPRKADHGQRTGLRCDLGDRPRTSLLLSALRGDWVSVSQIDSFIPLMHAFDLVWLRRLEGFTIFYT